MREALHVILIDLRVPCDGVRILGMVRQTVEPAVHSALRIGPRSQVARVKDGRYARNVGLESQRLEIEVELYMFVEGFRYAGGRDEAIRVHLACRFLRQFEPPLQ